MRPLGVSKLSVVELSEKYCVLLSRHWWCLFYSKSIFDPVMRGHGSNFRNGTGHFSTLHAYISKTKMLCLKNLATLLRNMFCSLNASCRPKPALFSRLRCWAWIQREPRPYSPWQQPPPLSLPLSPSLHSPARHVAVVISAAVSAGTRL